MKLTFGLSAQIPQEIVVIEFLTVDVELCCDDLSVFNGTGTDEPFELDVEEPSAFISTATDGCLTVTWDSDFLGTFGWEAVINCTPCPPIFNQSVAVANIGAFHGCCHYDKYYGWECSHQ
ncbi:MAG: hypothetical protein R2795_25425 [Saprospiraceae bacterium]